MGIGDWIGEHWKKAKEGWTGLSRALMPGQIAVDLMAIATSSPDWGEKSTAAIAWDSALQYGSMQLGNLGKGISPVTDLPVVKQVGELSTWLQKNAVSRPISTAMLAGDMADRPGGNFFSGDTWRQAWNDSERVTAGQAIVYNAAQLTGSIKAEDPNFDPRKSKDVYYNDEFYKNTSGGIDFILAFADPLRGAGKLARLGKTRLLDKAVTPKQVAGGALERQTFGRDAQYGESFDEAGGQLATRPEKLYQAAKNMSPSDFQRTFFNNFAQGGIVSTSLSAAAKVDDRATFADILLSARGNEAAYDRLIQSPGGARVAEQIGQYRNAYNVANTTARKADDAFSRQIAEAQTEAHAQSWVDQFLETDVDGVPKLGWADVKSSMTGRGTPRKTFGAMLSNGVRSGPLSNFVPVTVARWADPAAGYASHVDVNLQSSLKTFRANLDRAGSYMDDATRDKYITAYAAALTANERSRIAAMADNFLIGKIAGSYGVSKAEANRIISEASIRRQNFRQMLNSSQKYLPREFTKRAQQLADQGAVDEAKKLEELADEYRKLVDRGQLPNNVQFLNDDRGRLVIVPAKVDPDNPFLTSQAADLVPMTDYRKLDRIMSRYVGPKATVAKYEHDQQLMAQGGEAIYNIDDKAYKAARRKAAVGLTMGIGEDFYRAFNQVWSVAAVLRPGQTLRTLADDGMRSMTMFGVLPTLTSGMVGLARVPYNLTRRGATWAQDRQWFKSLRTLRGGNHTVDIDVDPGRDSQVSRRPSDSAGFYMARDPITGLASTQLGNTTVYDSLEAALVNGRIDLATYVDHVFWASKQGRVPFDLQALVEEYELGLIQRGTFRNTAAVYVLDATGRSAFANPRWQADLAESINNIAPGAKYGIVADPLTDDATHLQHGRAGERFEFGAATRLHVNPATGKLDDLDAIYDFVVKHVEDFISGARLHVSKMPNSQIRLSVARPKDMPKPFVESLSPRQKQEIAKGLRMRGSTGVRLKYGDKMVEIPGSMAGLDGDFARTVVSSRPNDMPYSVLLSERAGERAIAKSNLTANRDISFADGRDYGEAWERSVNAQLSNDPVARQFLQGYSVAQVLDWVEKTPDGARWLNDRGQRSSYYYEHVEQIKGLVDYLVPEKGGKELRDKVLNKEATINDLTRHYPTPADKDLLPVVNGQVTEVNLGTHVVQRWVMKKLDSYFKWMQDKPTDILVRNPFFDRSYKKYMTPMVQTYLAQLGDKAIASKDEIDRLARIARQQAIMDTRQYLYDATFRTDAADALSSIMPFSNAIADAAFKWLKIARERPFEVAANFSLLYTGAERAGLVYDQDGNHLVMENGEEVWYSPVTGERVSATDEHGRPYKHDRYIALAAPSTVANHLLGRNAIQPTIFSKSSLTNAIFDPSVNVGPVIALPVNEFALKNPEIAETDFVKKFVLPFGPTNDSTGMILPGMMRSAYQWFRDDESKASSNAMAIYQQMLTDYATGKRNTAPTIVEAQERAKSEQALRFLTSITSPVSIQTVNPYKPFTDYYNQLLRKHSGDENAALTEFRNNGVYDDFLYQVARVTKSNIAIPATIDGYRQYQAKKDTIRKYPDLAGLVVGRDGAGSFSKAVYEWEKNQTYDETGQTIREEMTIDESIADVEKRMVWQDYQKFMANVHNDLEGRGLAAMTDRGAEDLYQAYQTWVEAHKWHKGPNDEVELSPWYEDFRQTDGAYMDQRLYDMRTILTDNEQWLQGRVDLQGLSEYLGMRDRYKQAMDFYGYKSLAAKKASWLADQWNAELFNLKSTNEPFRQLFDRWLTRDTLTADGLVSAQVLSVLEGGDLA